MSIANYTFPFVPPPPQAYLGPQDFGGVHQAAAINSLLFDTPRYSQTRQTALPPSSSPSRLQTTNPRNVKDNRDPYRNQYPQKTRYQSVPSQATTLKGTSNDYDEYYNEPDYENEKDLGKNYPVGREESQLKGYYEESSSSSNSKSKRKLPNGQQTQQKTQQEQQQQQQQQPQQSQDWESHPPTYKRIANTFNSVPEPGARTSIHAVLDFDDDFEDYSYEDDDIEPVPPSLQRSPKPHVTPIEGPILIKNGSVPVVPLYSYPTVNNGSLVQIPILWTALSLALGLEIRGEIIRGVPCIKRFHQLFCPTAGNSYPIERIERFIDDNKALMKRMYGEFQMSTEYGPPAREVFETRRRNVKRQASPENPGPTGNPGAKPDSYFARHRPSRQSFRSGQSDNGRVDACESKIEIVTPYWASNSAGKIRAIVNTQHFEQAIHQEVCSKVQTKRCVGDCGCEQKYKWHRLLAYDPDNDCKGIFMDWFLFPSCCVCRCAPTFGGN